MAELFLIASRKDEERRERIVTALIRLAQMARAVGIHLEICGQRFGSELGKGATMLRAQLTCRVVHRVNDKQTAEMGLADVAPDAVLAAALIPAERPGTAVAADSSGGWAKIRTRTPPVPRPRRCAGSSPTSSPTSPPSICSAPTCLPTPRRPGPWSSRCRSRTERSDLP